MNPKINIPHPEGDLGGVSAILLFIIAFTAASFTLMAAIGQGSKETGRKTDSSCGYGEYKQIKDPTGKPLCMRQMLDRIVCAPCTQKDNIGGVNCNCKGLCEWNGGWDYAAYGDRVSTNWVTNTVANGGKVDASWSNIVSIAYNKNNGTMTVVREEITTVKDQCLWKN